MFFQNGQVIYGETNIATAGGTTNLTATSTQILNFTGSSTQTVVLPQGSTCIVGQFWEIYNSSSGLITLQYYGGASFSPSPTVSPGTSVVVKLVNNGSSAGTWVIGATGAGASSGSGKNYLSTYTASTSGGTPNPGNGNFENSSTSGWSLAHSSLSGTLLPTSTATAGTAFDSTHGGSAASGNLSLSVVTSGQIAGSYSGNLSSSAASVAGDMLISNAFYIDSEDQAKPLAIQLAFTAHSGGSNLNFSGTSSNSFAIYIYDVTNAAWIQPINVYGMTQVTGIGRIFAQFQTSANGTQYQLAIININASAGAYSLYVDDFSVGPQSIAGFAAGPSSIQVFTSGSGTYIPSAGTTQIKVRMAGGGGGGCGGGSGGGAGNAGGAGGDTTFGSIMTATGGYGANFYGSGAPGGSASVTTSSTVLQVAALGGGGGGICSILNAAGYSCGGGGGITVFGGSGLGGNNGSGSAAAANTGAGGGGGGTGSYGGSQLNGGGGGGAGGYAEAIITNLASSYSYTVGTGGSAGAAASNGHVGGAGGSGIIIVEEYKTAQTVSQYDGRVVAASYYCSTNQAGSSTSPFNFDTKEIDTHNAVTTGSGVWNFKAPVSGIYKVSVNNYDVSGSAYIAIYKNGTAYKGITYAGAGISPNSGTEDIQLNASDYIDIRIIGGGTLTISGAALSAGGASTISISLLSGAQQILAGQRIAARYQNSSAQSIPNSTYTQLTNYTKVYDSAGIMNATTGTITVPTTGDYVINAVTIYNYNGTGYREMSIYKNGTAYSIISNVSGGASGFLQGSDIISCNAGDTLSLWIYQNSGGALTISGPNYLSIKQI